MNSRMPCSITGGAQYDDDLVDLPELTEAEEQLLLSEIDPEWPMKFYSANVAWHHYWNSSERPLMQRLSLDMYRERASRLVEPIVDIGVTPSEFRRKAWI